MECLAKKKTKERECAIQKKKKEEKLRSVQFLSWVFLDTDHYNSASLENCHYNSDILKHAITIIGLPESCHFLRIQGRFGPIVRRGCVCRGRIDASSSTALRAPVPSVQSHRHYNGPALGGG